MKDLDSHILSTVHSIHSKHDGFAEGWASAEDVADVLHIGRSTARHHLNALVRSGALECNFPLGSRTGPSPRMYHERKA
jgi:predicted ArsR family transcriptional regulator